MPSEHYGQGDFFFLDMGFEVCFKLSFKKKKGERSRKFLGKSNNFYIDRDGHKNMLFAGTGKDELCV